MVNAAQRRFAIPDGDGRLIKFVGEQLAKESTQEDYGKRALRWTEVEIYRRVDGGYVTHVIGRSVVEGQRDLHTTVIALTPGAVYDALVHGPKPIWVEADVLAGAAERDPVLSAWLGDRLEVEDLDSGTAFGEKHVVARDDDRALRFYGTALGHGSSRNEADPDPAQQLWTQVSVYAVNETRAIAYPRYVIHKVQSEAGKTQPRKAIAWIVLTGREAIEVLHRQRAGTAWLEAAAFDALDQAAGRSEHFSMSLEGLLDNHAFKEIIGSAPSLNPDHSDSRRRRFLEILAGGAKIATEAIDSRKSRIIGWVGAVDAPPLPRRIFYRLARDRMIRQNHDRQPLTPGTVEWEISDLGVQALRS